MPETNDLLSIGPGRRLGTNDESEAKSESASDKLEIIDSDEIIHETYDPHSPSMLDATSHHSSKKIIKKKITGLRSEAKTLYEGPRKCSCCTNWVDEPPQDLHNTAKKSAEHGDFALVARKTGHGGDNIWKIQTLTVFSPYIMTMLRKALSDYPGVAMALDSATFDAPFEPLLHRWSEIDKGLQEEDDLKARNHFNLFRQVVEPEIAPHLKASSECKDHGVIPYDSVWTIFPPGSLISWERDGQSNIGKMVEAAYVTGYAGTSFHITCEQVDWNGECFGFTRRTEKIMPFEGIRAVTELSVMPLALKPDQEAIRNAHIARGKIFEELHGYHFKQYDGVALGTDTWYRKVQKRFNDRVVIDMFSYYHFEQMPKPELSPLDGVKPPSQITNAFPTFKNEDYISPPQPMLVDDNGIYSWSQPPPEPMDGRSRPRRGRRNNHGQAFRDAPHSKTTVDHKPLMENQLILTVPWVKGFVLKEKKWYTLAVMGVSPILWNDSFSNLVIANQEKDLLLAFANSKINSEMLFDDFVDGKGKGIIILLSGSPGVGKTLTAESIAEKMQVPLYTLSAGEIGIVPSTVESELKKALEICTMWNAILLLDEADVFLEKRELNSLKRNELVSIFLRLLEYYEGMMFLTTNRVSTIDPAFESRIDVSIDYPDLTPDLRLQIWTKFLSRGSNINGDGGEAESTVHISEQDLVLIAQLSLNGRQIKSAVKTAQLLATSKQEKLGMEHLKAVLRLHRLEAGVMR